MDDIQILTGDFRELGKDLADDSVDMVFADPVYQNIEDYADIAKLAARVLKPDSACLLWGEGALIPKYLPAVMQYLHFEYILTLFLAGANTGRHVKGKGRLLIKTTPCLWLSKGKSKPTCCVWDIHVGSTNRRKNGNHHEWQKDIDATVRWLEAFTNPGDLVYDPCVGSGTTAVACLQTGRRCIGHEIDAATADDARMRLATAQLPLFVPQPVPAQMEMMAGDE